MILTAAEVVHYEKFSLSLDFSCLLSDPSAKIIQSILCSFIGCKFTKKIVDFILVFVTSTKCKFNNISYSVGTKALHNFRSLCKCCTLLCN